MGHHVRFKSKLEPPNTDASDSDRRRFPRLAAKANQAATFLLMAPSSLTAESWGFCCHGRVMCWQPYNGLVRARPCVVRAGSDGDQASRTSRNSDTYLPTHPGLMLLLLSYWPNCCWTAPSLRCSKRKRLLTRDAYAAD